MNMHQTSLRVAPLDRTRDYLEEEGAYKLAATIRHFWALRGKQVKVWVQKQISSQSPTAGESVIFTVRSDMKGGQP